MQKEICHITGKEHPVSELVNWSSVRPSIQEEIRKDIPDWKETDFISETELSKYRQRYVENVLSEEMGEMTGLEKKVAQSIGEDSFLSDNLNEKFDKNLSFGDRLADKIAVFGGSWRFIIIFLSLLAVWMFINAFILTQKPFDPYPFILLNLILSCIAALQAPVIMMSQNRQEIKDRTRAEHDYQINLKAELEIRFLHEKIDSLLVSQNKRLLEIQQIQLELMEEILNKVKK
jgi:uncharacterized membrane protein